MTEPVKIKFAFVCEDSRREDNGKLMFIGVYGSNILVSDFPHQAALCLGVWIESSEHFNGPMSFQALLDDEKITDGSGSVKVGTGQSVTAIQPIPIFIPKEGILKFQIKFGDGKWQNAAELAVQRKTSPASNVSERPS